MAEAHCVIVLCKMSDLFLHVWEGGSGVLTLKKGLLSVFALHHSEVSRKIREMAWLSPPDRQQSKLLSPVPLPGQRGGAVSVTAPPSSLLHKSMNPKKLFQGSEPEQLCSS